MSELEARLAELGRTLPVVAKPLGAYVPATRSGLHIYTAGQLPLVDGALFARGMVIDEVEDRVLEGWIVDEGTVDVNTAAECCSIAAVNALAAAKSVLPDLDQLVGVTKVTGFVAGVPGFRSHPQVVNGASDVFGALFAGAGHARSAVGVATLPLGSPVELEVIFEVRA